MIVIFNYEKYKGPTLTKLQNTIVQLCEIYQLTTGIRHSRNNTRQYNSINDHNCNRHEILALSGIKEKETKTGHTW